MSAPKKAAAKKTRKKSKKLTLADLPSQPDPRAPIDGALLVRALQPLRKDLEADLLERARQSPELSRALSARHEAERADERTADDLATWERRLVEQVAAAWILSCVFVRTLEDRDLLAQRRLAGPGARDAQRTFFQLAPSLSEREYLLSTFREMTRLPAAAGLFDDHNAVWMLAPSADGAKALLQFFRTASDGASDEAPALRFGQPDTRFLGDLYQDLNESVRKRYALLQTPDFVESFILDRTLTPAIEKFGLDDTDLIDPTCGSGHFLLGAFDRLFDEVQRHKPALGVRQAAAEALNKVYGADINPFAVAIAKFRLTLSFVDKGGYDKLQDAPQLPLHVAVADSLLYNPQHEQRELFHQEGVDAADWERRAFAFEDEAEARAVLHRQYAAVVGNPPYITVKDSVLRDRYRALYPSAFRSYSLAVPFCERLFQLAKKGGRVGQITANSFMKREFGKKLIEDYLPSVDLDLIVNTSGAYIPGHGTPTVLLFGSHQEPQRDDVLAVLAKRGEPSTPDDPAKGLVWSSIAAHVDDVGHDDDYISVARVERKGLAAHPWSLAGGGAGELKALLEDRREKTLGDVVDDIGFASFTGLDDAFIIPAAAARTRQIEAALLRPMVAGESVRDWSASPSEVALTPYDPASHAPIPLEATANWSRFLWRYRAVANGVMSFGGRTRGDNGENWWEWYRWQAGRYQAALRITFAFVATHNHFVLDRGGKVFSRTAPIIKLPETATEEDHLALLAYLNSSTACFWMKQVFHNKGQGGVNEGLRSDVWDQFHEFSGTPLKAIPLPPTSPTLAALARKLLAAAERVDQIPEDAASLCADAAEVRKLEGEYLLLQRRLLSMQERLDWEVYALFGIVEAAARPAFPEAIQPGSRPFEFLMAERDLRGASSEWFRRNGYAAPADSLRLVEHEALIRRSKQLSLIEQPEYKRPWRFPAFSGRLRAAALARIGRLIDSVAAEESSAMASVAVLQQVAADSAWTGLAKLAWQDADWFASAHVTIESASVPYLAAHRYKDAGLEKRAAWESTWDLQRREDAKEDVGDIPVPPKYAQKDFRASTYWRLRGKLDVPKERFISYPGCESDEDGEPVYGWAGWDHAERAKALVALYQDRKTREGWDKTRLTPMLAGVLELLPWLKQWHDEPTPDFDATYFEAYDAFLDGELRDLELTREDLEAWRPPDKKRRGRKKK